MECQKYIDALKQLQNLFFTFLNNPNEDSENDFQNILSYIKSLKIYENKEDFSHFLCLIAKISENHHRQPFFNDKICQLLKIHSKEIKKSLSNIEIFDIFKNSKLILLFLIENEIIIVDDCVLHILLDKKYCHFFYPEIKKNCKEIEKVKSIEEQLLKISPTIFDNFEENRHIGENEAYICSLIRNDSIEDFISYITRNNISLHQKLKDSIFESNPKLIGEKLSIIEYASFFGSIQVIQFLKMNSIEYPSTLWKYSIHSNNPELIHFLEENHVQPEDNNYMDSFLEAIECHHNEIAGYIKDNLLPKINDDVDAISKAARKKRIDIIYYLLLKETKIEKSLFEKTSVNFKLVIPTTITTIGSYAFNECNKLTHIVLPSSITKIENNTFRKCANLISLDIPSSVKSIENNAFRGCVSLKRIEIPFSITAIKTSTFHDCKKLEIVELPLSITEIGFRAFKNCSFLHDFEIPSTVLSIHPCAFYGCNFLTSIVIPNTITVIEKNVFKDCTKLKTVVIPNSVLSIGDCAFFNCNSLEDLILPNNLKSIGVSAFSRCYHIYDITIPKSVVSIGRDAFKICYNLTHVKNNSALPSDTIKKSAFKYCRMAQWD